MMPLDRNESYWMLDDELAKAAVVTSARELSTYPDYDELKTAIARYAGVTSGEVFVAPGSASAIEHVARAYASDGGEVVLPVPTFYGYETILEYIGAKMIPIAYEKQDGRFIFPREKTVAALKSNSAKVLFLCQPNNPLGCSLSGEDITALVEAARGSDTLLVSDEAYFEFSSGASFLPYLAELPNLVVIRSLSKAFALSGARVGYALAAPHIIKKLEGLMIPWSIAHSSVTAALALLLRVDKVAVRRAVVIAAREHFTNALKALPGVTVYPSETNFILIHVPGASRIGDTFLERGIRVALGESMSGFQEAKELLKDTLRIVIPAPESESFVIDVLREALS